MKTNYKMIEATNTKEAIISILDVLRENPLWLNKVNNSLLAMLQVLELEEQKFLLTKSVDEQVTDLFVEIKTEYYNFKDNTQWNY
tara:strand:+ start:614 stop:868 length:255 start_codon:yes stop_codon:yes gene_type:complete